MIRRVALVSCAILIAIVSFFYGQRLQPDNDLQINRYKFLSRRVVEIVDNDYYVKFSQLRTQLRSYVANNELSGSIYFEYLPTGTSIRINGDELEVGASLLKLPVAMELLKAQELGLLNVTEKVALKEEWLDPSFGDLYEKGPGYLISLQDAMERMLRDSDNTALNAIAHRLQGTLSLQDSAISSLDIDVVQNEDQTLSISARSYTSILKCLYYSCYLNYEHSQEILTILTDTPYDDRLVSGVTDKNTLVAHKTGNYSQGTQSDCGIIYRANRHYALCVMLKVNNTEEGDMHISRMSRIVSDYITSL